MKWLFSLPSILILILSVGPSMAIANSNSSATTELAAGVSSSLQLGKILKSKTNLVSDLELVFENNNIEFYRSRKDGLNYSIQFLPKGVEEARELNSDDMTERVRFFGLFKLRNISIISSQKTENSFFHLMKYSFENFELFAIEIHDFSATDHIVYTLNYDSQQACLNAWKQVLSVAVGQKQASNEENVFNRLPATEASGTCTDCNSGPSLFQQQVRSIMTPIQESLKASCESGKSTTANPTAAAIGQSIVSCLRGITASVADLVGFAYELSNFAFKQVFNSDYRSKTISGMGSILSSVWRDPAGIVSKLFASAWAGIENEFAKIKTCSAQYRAQVACKVMTDLLGLRGLYKVGSKALTGKSGKAIATDTEKVTTSALQKNSKDNISSLAKSDGAEQIIPMEESRLRRAIETDAKESELGYDSYHSPATNSSGPKKASDQYREHQVKMANQSEEWKALSRQLEENHDKMLDPFRYSEPGYAEAINKEKEALLTKRRQLSAEMNETSEQMRSILEKKMKRAGIKFRRLSESSDVTKEYQDLKDYMGIRKDISRLRESIDRLEEMKAPRIAIDFNFDQLRKAEAYLKKIKAKYQEGAKHERQRQALQSVDSLSDLQISAANVNSIARFENGYELLAIPDAPKMIEGIERRFGTKVIIRDPIQQSFSTSKGTFYAWTDVKNEIALNPESFLDYRGVKGTALLHEVRHNYFYDLRSHRGGSAYDVTIIPSKEDFKGNALGKVKSYKQSFTVEEISNFERDARIREGKAMRKSIRLGQAKRPDVDLQRFELRDAMLTATENKLARAYKDIKAELEASKANAELAGKPKSFKVAPTPKISKPTWTAIMESGDGGGIQVVVQGNPKGMSTPELANALLKKIEEAQTQMFVHRQTLEDAKLLHQDLSEAAYKRAYKRHLQEILPDMLSD